MPSRKLFGVTYVFLRSSKWNFSAALSTDLCTMGNISDSASFCLSESSSRGILRKNYFATETSASYGQLLNQSRVQQFIRDGNIRERTLSCSPTGDMQRMMWKLSRSDSIYCYLVFSLLTGIFILVRIGSMNSSICARSALSYRPVMSPVFKMLLMSSRKDSYMICVSFIMKVVGFSSHPEMSICSLICSLNFDGSKFFASFN